GTLGDFSMNYDRDLTPKDRLRFIVRHELSRYDIPNEQVQQIEVPPDGCNQPPPGVTWQPPQPPCQRQTADNIETMGIASYQHKFFREGYFKGTATINHGRNEWKFGFESDNIFLNENFSYNIPDIPADKNQFDSSTPLTFAFAANRPDLEQSVFVQD